jgi:hypothetical protein
VVWACRPVDSVVSRVDQMEGSQIIRGRGRSRKTIRESWIAIWCMIEHYGVV